MKKNTPKVDITGLRNGRLVAISRTEQKGRGNSFLWLCKCDCGNTTLAVSGDLRPHRGSKKSCGCGRYDKVTSNLPDPQQAQINSVFRNYTGRSEERGLGKVKLTYDEFYQLSQSPCHYCGAVKSNTCTPIKGRKYGESFSYNGIDRIDSTKGYELFNCVPCCKTCNVAKSNMPYDTFIAWVRKVVAHRDKFYKDIQ